LAKIRDHATNGGKHNSATNTTTKATNCTALKDSLKFASAMANAPQLQNKGLEYYSFFWRLASFCHKPRRPNCKKILHFWPNSPRPTMHY